MSQYGVGTEFRDLRGLAAYPVDGAQLADARLTLRSYAPVAHFTRRLTISETRLEDWAAVAVDGAQVH